MKNSLFRIWGTCVGRALKLAIDEEVWFKAIPGGDKMRIFSEYCDVDRWGDEFQYGYHPEGAVFVDRIMEIYQQMIERCCESRLNACDDYF